GVLFTDAASFKLAFPDEELAPRACATIAFFRKCFTLRELRATESGLELDFGSPVADRRYSF
ncbi:MAG: hypothetical protein ACREID_08325, partial [Planctomycetota bacterium]